VTGCTAAFSAHLGVPFPETKSWYVSIKSRIFGSYRW